MSRWIAALVWTAVVTGVARGAEDAPALAFSVVVDPQKRSEPVTGRVVVYLVREGSRVRPGTPPAAGPFFEDPQPMFGVDVKDIAPGTPIVVDDAAAGFPAKLSRLPKGTYRVQAVVDMHRLDSSWRREPGNMFSQPVTLEIDPASPPAEPMVLTVREVVFPRDPRPMEGLEIVSVRSELLSAFRGTEVMLTAGVVKPIGHDASRTYPTVYVIPGFGGDHTMAYGEVMARRRAAGAEVAHSVLWGSAFTVVLNPEGPNGHHLFADSDNNGPVGTALVTELIPELEKRFNLIAEPAARVLTGHSSGAWASVWLALRHPETFGAAWASAPDPLDFRSFQRSSVYDVDNWYAHDPATDAATLASDPTAVAEGDEVPSYREDGSVRMTVRQENAMEEVIGPANSSGQQWDSWAAVFGPRDAASGRPAALYDAISGAMNPRVAERWKRYDIGALVRAEPQRYGAIFRRGVRVLMGGADNYYLNEGAQRLKDELDRLPPDLSGPGGVTIVPGLDHHSILTSPAAAAWPKEIEAHFRDAGFIKD